MDERHEQTPVAPAVVPEWGVLIERKLDELRSKVLGLHQGPRPTLADLSREYSVLVAAAAWHRANGNITRAAEWLGVSRRAVRIRVERWCKEHPQAQSKSPSRTSDAGKAPVQRPSAGASWNADVHDGGSEASS